MNPAKRAAGDLSGTGMKMAQNNDLPDWRAHDAAVQSDFANSLTKAKEPKPDKKTEKQMKD